MIKAKALEFMTITVIVKMKMDRLKEKQSGENTMYQKHIKYFQQKHVPQLFAPLENNNTELFNIQLHIQRSCGSSRNIP